MLTYIGEKIYSWSDPEKLDSQDILDTVALYYLSRSFSTSVVIYNQVYVLSLSIYDRSTNLDLTFIIGLKG